MKKHRETSSIGCRVQVLFSHTFYSNSQFPLTHTAIVETVTALQEEQRYSSRFSPKLTSDTGKLAILSSCNCKTIHVDTMWTPAESHYCCGWGCHLANVTDYTRSHQAFLPCFYCILGERECRGETACLSIPEISSVGEVGLDSARPQAIVKQKSRAKPPAMLAPHYSFFSSCLCLQAGKVTDPAPLFWWGRPEKTEHRNQFSRYGLPYDHASKHCIFFKQCLYLTFYIQVHNLMATYSIRERTTLISSFCCIFVTKFSLLLCSGIFVTSQTAISIGLRLNLDLGLLVSLHHSSEVLVRLHSQYFKSWPWVLHEFSSHSCADRHQQYLQLVQ